MYLSNPLIVTYCQKVSLSQPQFIKHIFFVQKVELCNQRWQNTTLNSNKWISNSSREFAFLFQTNESLQCMRHRICPCISNKQIFSVMATELDFVFCNKTVREIPKNIKYQLTLNFYKNIEDIYTRNSWIRFLTRWQTTFLFES